MKNNMNRPSLLASDELKQAEWLLRIALKRFFKSNEKQLGDALKTVVGIAFEAHSKAGTGLAVKEGKARAKKRREEMTNRQETEKE